MGKNKKFQNFPLSLQINSQTRLAHYAVIQYGLPVINTNLQYTQGKRVLNVNKISFYGKPQNCFGLNLICDRLNNEI